jgi:hypothetical protein
MSDPAATLSTGVGVPQPDPTNDMRAPKPGMCHGCGGYHGSVNTGLRCLEHALAGQRALVAEKSRHIDVLLAAVNRATQTPEARPPDVIGAPAVEAR